MIGCIKAISPCVKSASPKLFLDLHTVLAPSGEERTLNAAAQVERARWCYRRFDSDTQTRCGSVTVMVLVSSASGPRVSGCIRAGRYGRVEGCWTSPANIPTRVNTLGHQEQRHAEPERRPMHHCRTAH